MGRLRHVGIGGPMPRGRTLIWTIAGSVIALVAVVIGVIVGTSGGSSNAASTTAPTSSTGATSQPTASTPVVAPPTSGALSYLSDMKPAGALGEMVNPGPVTISGSVYPKSISFYCNVGDATAFPKYTLKHNARRFQATLGVAPTSPPQFEGGILIDGNGRTLRTFTVTVGKPKTVDVSVKGIHTLQLECFGSGNSYTGGEAVGVVWGNARISGSPS